MSAQHTPGPWSQGVTLSTPTTRRWSEDEIKANNEREQRMVFAQFSSMDEGRGRVRIAICERVDDARLIAAAPELLDALEDVLLQRQESMRGHGHREVAVMERARAAIAKATGSAK